MKTLGRLVVWCITVIAVVVWATPQLERLIYPVHYNSEITAAAATYHVPRNLLLAVIREESHFDPNSQSRVSADGLMQLMPETSKWIASRRGLIYNQAQIHQPETNIDYGTWYLRYLIDQLKDNTLAIEAYNAGIVNVIEWEKKNPGYVGFAETDHFVRRVKDSKAIYDRLYGENWEKL